MDSKEDQFMHKMLMTKGAILRSYLHSTEESDGVRSPVNTSPALDSLEVVEHSLGTNSMYGRLFGKMDATLFACLAAVSIESALRIPGLTQEYGGWWFLIALYISLISIVAPVCCIQLFLGQVSTRPAIDIYGTLAPFFAGVGHLFVVVRLLTSITTRMNAKYPKILLTVIWFFFYSENAQVCNKSSDYCYEYIACTIRDHEIKTNLSNATSFFATKCLGPRHHFLSDNYEMIKNRLITSGVPKTDLEQSLQVNILASVILICVYVFLSTKRGVLHMHKSSFVMILFIIYGLAVNGLINLSECEKNCYDFGLRTDASVLYSPHMWRAALSAACSLMGVADGSMHSIGVYMGFRSNPIRTTAAVMLYATILIIMCFFITFAANSAAFTEFGVRDLFEWASSNHVLVIPCYQSMSIMQYLGLSLFICAIMVAQMPFHLVSCDILYRRCFSFYSYGAHTYRTLGYPITVLTYIMWITAGLIVITLFGISDQLKQLLWNTNNFVLFAEMIIIVAFYGVDRLIVNLKTVIGGQNVLTKLIWPLYIFKKYTQFVVLFGTMCAFCSFILCSDLDTINIASLTLIGMTFIPFIRIIYLGTNHILFSVDISSSFVNTRRWGPSNVQYRREIHYDERAARLFT